jgi:hypothetical protein
MDRTRLVIVTVEDTDDLVKNLVRTTLGSPEWPSAGPLAEDVSLCFLPRSVTLKPKKENGHVF